MSQRIEEILQHLRASATYYDYGEHLAFVENGGLHVLSEDALRYQLGLEFMCLREVRKQKVECEFPQRVAREILGLRSRRKLKALDAVVTAPTVRLDGTVLDKPGYDPETRLYLDLPATRRVVSREPTLDDALAALTALMAPFSRFPFVDNLARAAHLAAMLTAAVRPVLYTAPGFAYDAPTAGTGKTLLASCVSAVAGGERPDVWPHVSHEEEIRKRLLAALMSGAHAMLWDNVVGEFDSAVMAALMTSSGYIDRLLGASKVLRIPNRLLVTMTGNNLVVKGDLMRRMIICRIDAGVAEPYARTFDSDPLAICLEQRGMLLAAACTLIRARMLLQPEPLGPGRLAGLEDWDTLVRQTVVWAGHVLAPGSYGDPLDLIRASYADDQDAASLSVLLTELHDEFRGAEFIAKDVLDRVYSKDMQAAIEDLGGERALVSARSMGRVLRKYVDRPVHGLRLVSRRGSGNSLAYRIRSNETG